MDHVWINPIAKLQSQPYVPMVAHAQSEAPSLCVVKRGIQVVVLDLLNLRKRGAVTFIDYTVNSNNF